MLGTPDKPHGLQDVPQGTRRQRCCVVTSYSTRCEKAQVASSMSPSSIPATHSPDRSQSSCRRQ